MRILLDTHTLIWWHTASPLLSRRVHQALSDEANTVFISFANAWEMQIRTQLGKLMFDKPWHALIAEERRKNGFEWRSAHLSYLEMLDHLPLHHRDPFDRLLIAQAASEA